MLINIIRIIFRFFRNRLINYKLLYKIENYIFNRFQNIKIYKSQKYSNFNYDKHYIISSPNYRIQQELDLKPDKLTLLYLCIPSPWEEEVLIPDVLLNFNIIVFRVTDYFSFSDFFVGEQRKLLNNKIIDFVKCNLNNKPKFVLSYITGSYLDLDTVNIIKNYGIPYISYHLDDRLHYYGKKHQFFHTGPNYLSGVSSLNLTNRYSSIFKYSSHKSRVMFWPEGSCIYEDNNEIIKDIDISFIGAKYGIRAIYINNLIKSGYKIHCYGQGWDNEKISRESMLDIYRRSKINLGFGFVNNSNDQCLKGRDFEVPATGNLYLTSYNDDLSKVYNIGDEVLAYSNYYELEQKIFEILSNIDDYANIANNGKKAVIERHRWAHRINTLFKMI